MLGTLNSDEIESLLFGQVLGRIGCIFNGRPYVVPVTYVYDGRRVICHSAVGQKIEAMRERSEVCFEVEHVDSLGTWQSVVANGRYEELHGLDAANALGLLVSQLLPIIKSTTQPSHGIKSVTPHGQIVPGGDTVVYCIHLDEKSGRFEKS